MARINRPLYFEKTDADLGQQSSIAEPVAFSSWPTLASHETSKYRAPHRVIQPIALTGLFKGLDPHCDGHCSLAQGGSKILDHLVRDHRVYHSAGQ